MRKPSLQEVKGEIHERRKPTPIKWISISYLYSLTFCHWVAHRPIKCHESFGLKGFKHIKIFHWWLRSQLLHFHYERWEGINSYLCLWKFLPLNTMIPWGFSWLVFQEVNLSSRSRYIGWECKPENLKHIFCWIICLTFYKDKKTKSIYLK